MMFKAFSLRGLQSGLYASGLAVLLSSASAFAQATYTGNPEIGSGLNTPQPAYGVMAQGARPGLAGGSLGTTIPALSVDQMGDLNQMPSPQAYQAPAPLLPVNTINPVQATDLVPPPTPQDFAAYGVTPVVVDPAFQNAPAVNVMPQIDADGYETQIIQVPVPVYQPQYAAQPIAQPVAVPAQDPMMMPSPTTSYPEVAGNGIDPSIMPSPLFKESDRTLQSMNPQPYPSVPAQPGLEFQLDSIPDMGSETLITRKIGDMRSDLNKLQDAIAIGKEQLENLRYSAELQAADYYAVVAAIQARLQAGSTPGNPRLVNSWNVAQDRLDRLSEDVGALGDLAGKVAAQANMGAFLLDATRATYGLSGALESDHANLEVLEDDVTNTVLVINRLLNETTDDINRRTAYLATERKNLQTLAVGISKGELFGRSLTNQYFQRVTDPLSLGGIERLRAEGKRPLAVIRFNQDQVNYQQPVYAALNDAIRQNPDAEFELIAVTPNAGTSSEMALASTTTKTKAEDVVRTLSNMGLPNTKMQVSSALSTEADSPEVHIYIR